MKFEHTTTDEDDVGLSKPEIDYCLVKNFMSQITI